MVMNITKIRDIFAVGLGIVSMVALALAVIGHYEKKELNVRLDLVNNELEEVVSANATQQQTIDFLFSQREIDEVLLIKLDKSYTALTEDSELARKTLEELKREDSDFTRVLNQRHPVAINRMLNAIGEGSNGDQSDQAATTD
ncbi:hypothetical protein pD_gene0066 [Vibrio phage 033B]|nr:hypothetical protein pD_gene0066 [Vibrio phage 033B]